MNLIKIWNKKKESSLKKFIILSIFDTSDFDWHRRWVGEGDLEYRGDGVGMQFFIKSLD